MSIVRCVQGCDVMNSVACDYHDFGGTIYVPRTAID